MPTLQFKGKTFVQNHHLAVKYHQLVPKKELSCLTSPRSPLQMERGQGVRSPDGEGNGVRCSLHDNLIIHGDNLKALKALLPTYAGKIKCIYIDPPYNTGNENWVYNDNVNSPMLKEWLGKVVDKEDLTRHDKWLCMMMPRLKLLRELLSEEGAIFVSIDDNEQHNLRCLMDEVFGEQNFINNIIWEKKFSPQNDAKYFSDNHDFIVCFAKNKIDGEQKIGWINNLLPRTEGMEARYKNPDKDVRGDWTSGDISVKSYSETYDYVITTPSGKKVSPPRGACWRFSKEKLQELIVDNRIWFGEKGDNIPRLKRFLSEVKQGLVPVTIWEHTDVGHNQEARQELKEIFNEEAFPFDTPKPVRLLKRIIQIATNANDIILDSYAGSGTTAHAVLELNKEDGGNRKFILVEQEEYANSITAERVRRVIKRQTIDSSDLIDLTDSKSAVSKGKKNKTTGNQINQENQIQSKVPTFSYFELGPSIEMESILTGKSLPGYDELARYIFYTATGTEFDEKKINRKTNFIGSTKDYELYMHYEPNIEWLKQNALTLDGVRDMPKYTNKQRLVFAPAKYVDDETCRNNRIDFCQLPYEIYRLNR